MKKLINAVRDAWNDSEQAHRRMLELQGGAAATRRPSNPR
jgi:hypothetical protein